MKFHQLSQLAFVGLPLISLSSFVGESFFRIYCICYAGWPHFSFSSLATPSPPPLLKALTAYDLLSLTGHAPILRPVSFPSSATPSFRIRLICRPPLSFMFMISISISCVGVAPCNYHLKSTHKRPRRRPREWGRASRRSEKNEEEQWLLDDCCILFLLLLWLMLLSGWRGCNHNK